MLYKKKKEKEARDILVEAQCGVGEGGASEWIRGITNISSKVQYANIKGQGVARGLQYQTAQCVNCRECSHLQRHYDQATKGLRSQNAWHFHCGKYVHLQQKCEQGISKGNGFSKYKPGR